MRDQRHYDIATTAGRRDDSTPRLRDIMAPDSDLQSSAQLTINKHWGHFNQLIWNLLQMHIILPRCFIFYTLNLASYVNSNSNKTDE